jgi:hypothetical protein
MMRVASSLTNRIFLASTVLAVLALGFAFYYVNARVSEEAEADLRRSVNAAATLIDRRQQDLTESFTKVARIAAEVPQLKLRSPPATRSPFSRWPFATWDRELELYLVTDRIGAVLATVGSTGGQLSAAQFPPDSLEELSALTTHPRGLLQMISAPLFIESSGVREFLGRLTVGSFMDDTVASRLRS